MAELPSEVRNTTDMLDAVGNTTKAVKGKPVLHRAGMLKKSTGAAEAASSESVEETTKNTEPPRDFATQGEGHVAGVDIEDFTMIPKLLDGKLKRLDTDGALRSTVIKAREVWLRKRQDNFLTDAKTTRLHKTALDSEKKKAFDLLDSLSRSGTLSVECSELHVIVAVSHCFENDVMGTVIEDNVNPISKVERSSLLLASTTFGVETTALIGDQLDVERLGASFPLLFGSLEEDE